LSFRADAGEEYLARVSFVERIVHGKRGPAGTVATARLHDSAKGHRAGNAAVLRFD
jgi:hypothetical protein